MRIAQGEHHRVLALHFGAVADADDFQVARPSPGDAFHRIVDQRARQAMQRRLGIILAGGDQVAIFLLHGDAGGNARLQLALGSLHGDHVALDLHLHPLRDRDRFFANSRH